MKPSIRLKLEKTADRFEEVGRLLADPQIAGGSQKFRELSMEYSRLEPVAAGFREYVQLEAQDAAAQHWRRTRIRRCAGWAKRNPCA